MKAVIRELLSPMMWAELVVLGMLLGMMAMIASTVGSYLTGAVS